MSLQHCRWSGFFLHYPKPAGQALSDGWGISDGRPDELLLPKRVVCGLRPTRRGQPERLRPLRQVPSPPALLQGLQGPLLRAQGHPAVRLPHARRQGQGHPPPPRRRQRHPPDRPPRRRPSRYRRPAGSRRRRSRPRRSRRARGFFPLGRARSSSTRPGRSSPRSRRTATRPTRPTTTRGTGGTTSPTTPSTSWSWPSSPVPAPARPPGRSSAR